jgi:hypothetical protein
MPADKTVGPRGEGASVESDLIYSPFGGTYKVWIDASSREADEPSWLASSRCKRLEAARPLGRVTSVFLPERGGECDE